MPQEKYDNPQQGGPENQETRNAPGTGQGYQQSPGRQGNPSEGQQGGGTPGQQGPGTSAQRDRPATDIEEDDENLN